MKATAFILLLLSLLVSQVSFAKENFGDFPDPLKGEFIIAKPRPVFKLVSEFRFLDPNGLLWRVPPANQVDGASIPQAFWSFIGGPFEGGYIKASVIHDYYCDKRTRTAHDTHRNFYYGMRAAGVEKWKAKFMYWAVATFGPSWRLEKRIFHDLMCTEAEGTLKCNQTPKVTKGITVQSTIDLDDPDTLAAALSKASTVARSLKTTDGEVLDISSAGEVEATLDNIAKSANRYHDIFIKNEYINSPSKLGVLSKWDTVGLDEVESWKDGKLPKYSDAVILKPESLKKTQAGAPFKLGPKNQDLLKKQIDLKSLEMESVHQN